MSKAVLLLCTFLALCCATQTFTNPPELACNTNECKTSPAVCRGRNAYHADADSCGGSGGHAMHTQYSGNAPDGFGEDRFNFGVVNGATTGRFEEYGNGEVGEFARLFGTLRGHNNPAHAFLLDLELVKVQKTSAIGVKNELSSSCSSQALINSWQYFALRTDIPAPATLTGIELYDGLTVYFTLESSGHLLVQLGDGASQKNLKFGVSSWLKYANFTYDNAKWPTTDSRKRIKFNPNKQDMSDGDLNINLECACQCDNPPPPNPVCGNNIVESGEECDGGVCCSPLCKYSTQVCRPAAGDCDVPETCSGSSASCPPDQYAPSTQVCKQKVGFCDVTIDHTCPGDDKDCHYPPGISLDQGVYGFDAFNVVSFKDFLVGSGDVEGRLAVAQNFVSAGGFTVGLKTDSSATGNDYYVPYALVGGHNVTYPSGSVHPDGTGTSEQENIFVGHVFVGPEYLAMRVGFGVVPGDRDESFQYGQQWYSELSTKFAALPDNVDAVLQYGDGLFLTCQSNSAAVHVATVSGATISATNWFSLSNCNFQASFIINIEGTEDVTFKGDKFPHINERVVFNVVGNRNVYFTTGVGGNILAPTSTAFEPQGVTYGLVIVGDFQSFVQANKPNCVTFAPVVVTGKTSKPAPVGSNKVPVLGTGGFTKGDKVKIGGQDNTITGAEQDENGDISFTLDQPLGGDVPAGTTIQTTVEDPKNANRPPLEVGMESSASALAVGAVALIALALF